MVAIQPASMSFCRKLQRRSAARVQPLPFAGSFVLFMAPTLLMWGATRWGIPWLRAFVPGPDILCWFIAGSVVFAGLFKSALVAYWIDRRRGASESFAERFRFKPLRASDVVISLAALATCGVTSAIIQHEWEYLAATTHLVHAPELTPSFIRFERLTADTWWILAAWLPLFFFNIAGEELWWRGYVLPREEEQHGKCAFLVHAAGLALFHLPLGIDLTIILTPFLLALPWVVQRQKSIWPGFIVHGLLNGGGFLAVAFGLV